MEGSRPLLNIIKLFIDSINPKDEEIESNEISLAPPIIYPGQIVEKNDSEQEFEDSLSDNSDEFEEVTPHPKNNNQKKYNESDDDDDEPFEYYNRKGQSIYKY
jgi:ABC-type oligopeptide transport system ATPase subunit